MPCAGRQAKQIRRLQERPPPPPPPPPLAPHRTAPPRPLPPGPCRQAGRSQVPRRGGGGCDHCGSRRLGPDERPHAREGRLQGGLGGGGKPRLAHAGRRPSALRVRCTLLCRPCRFRSRDGSHAGSDQGFASSNPAPCRASWGCPAGGGAGGAEPRGRPPAAPAAGRRRHQGVGGPGRTVDGKDPLPAAGAGQGAGHQGAFEWVGWVRAPAHDASLHAPEPCLQPRCRRWCPPPPHPGPPPAPRGPRCRASTCPAAARTRSCTTTAARSTTTRGRACRWVQRTPGASWACGAEPACTAAALLTPLCACGAGCCSTMPPSWSAPGPASTSRWRSGMMWWRRAGLAQGGVLRRRLARAAGGGVQGMEGASAVWA